MIGCDLAAAADRQSAVDGDQPGKQQSSSGSEAQMRSALLLCCLVEAPADRRRLAAFNYMEVDKLTASDAAADDLFGWSVAIDGDTIVVGAHDLVYWGGSGWGSAYVFRTSDGGATYVEVAKLTAADASNDDRFGISVAIDGGTIVVGASGDDDAGSNSGSVHVFRTTDGGATYIEVAKLMAADAAASVGFGYSLAIDGGTMVIGASRYGNGGSGSAYVFRTTDGGATYAQVAKLTAADAAENDKFGFSVAIDGDTVVVGADGGEAAYVFRTSDGGSTYGQVAKLTASDAAAGDDFGYSVAIDGDTIVVGAYIENSYRGSAYVFRTSDGGATYVELAKLTASDAASHDRFGSSVAIDGDTVVVGAYGAGTCGAAYVFRTTDGGATYGQVAKLTAADASTWGGFGFSVAISNGTVVAGSPCHDQSCTNLGSAYVFSLLATKQVDDVLAPWEIALIAIACLIFGVGCFVCLRTMRKSPLSATAWTRTKAYGAAAIAWMRTKAHGAAATATKISPAAPPAAETPPMLRTTSVLPMGTVEAVQAPEDAEAAPPILGEVVTHSTVLSVSN
jgi:hypothetical protein